MHHNGCTPAIGGRLSGRRAGCCLRGMFHGVRLAVRLPRADRVTVA